MNFGAAQQRTSLETLIDNAGGAVPLLRGSSIGPYVFPGIPPEFTNWQEEVRAWHHGVALLELSYHMAELHLRGPDALELLKRVAINKFDPFRVLRGKQVVVTSPEGYVIGDAILFREEEEFFRVVGAPFAADWIEYQASISGLQVEATRHLSWSVVQAPRDVFRVQVQGPSALALMREVTQGSLPEISFFGIGEFQIAGVDVRALRHGMAGEPGFEIYGPWDKQQAVRDALEKAGENYAMRKVGALAYSTTGTQSGWMPMPLPAIYDGDGTKPYREWLDQYFLESVASLGGSFQSDRISDYYVDPVELGYGMLADPNRDFIGRDAVLDRVANPRRKKVSFVWNQDDVISALQSGLFEGPETRAKSIAIPNPMYSTFQYDAVMKGGDVAGISQWCCHTPNGPTFLSLGTVDIAHAAPGTELTLLWGDPGSKRRTVEAHNLREIRVTVAPAPYFDKVIKSGQQ
ncbi:aminomethyl transferase family protein [Sphingobium terrigena]|uniref:Aminomethyl transferase family protein n=1 Tax=Sphingobium terrigena TaxID=2304063 RepID=A0A418YYK9_9SPHN|nr:aminomethyltransferase family protein [Sphingobium terrigena]RJG57915.1 aminomethyl transferase family protein [Sphingobium terrigena]